MFQGLEDREMERKLSHEIATVIDHATIAAIIASRQDRARIFGEARNSLLSRCSTDSDRLILELRLAEASLRAVLSANADFDEFSEVVDMIKSAQYFEEGRREELLDLAHTAGSRIWPNKIERIRG